MKKVIFITASAIILSACTLPFGKNRQSALKITSEPTATVYLNEQHVGSTPFYKDDLKPGSYAVKLIPQSDPNRSWQTQVVLKPRLLTNITKNFGTSDSQASHFILSLEPLAKTSSTEIAVVVIPDSAVVKLDSQPIGFSPVSTDTTPGDHQISIGSPGYQQLDIPVKAVEGHKLTISVSLAKDQGLSADPTATSSAQLSSDQEPTPTPQSSPSSATSSSSLTRPYVTITETGTGWLRVRSEPNTNEDNEVAKIDVGKSYPFIEKNDLGWYQIEYASGKKGWISGKYADLYR